MHHQCQGNLNSQKVFYKAMQCLQLAESETKHWHLSKVCAIHQIPSKTYICQDRHSLPKAFRGAAAEWLCLAHCRTTTPLTGSQPVSSLCTTRRSFNHFKTVTSASLRRLLLFLLGIFQNWLSGDCFFNTFSLLGFLFLGLGDFLTNCLLDFCCSLHFNCCLFSLFADFLLLLL